jgi:eukaryotic-like serine/threonine-protein kinase
MMKKLLTDPEWWQALGAVAAVIVAVAALLVSMGVIGARPLSPTPASVSSTFDPTGPTAYTPSLPIGSTPTLADPTPTPGIGSTMISAKDGMEMVYVPAGPFLMGSTDDDPDAQANEKPQRIVYLDAYWIDRTEVTTAMYHRFQLETGYSKLDGRGLADYPMANVNWYDASAYCLWAGRRLPSEAEWEKAARGTDGRLFPWGSEEPDCDKAWFRGCEPRSFPVGSFPVGASPYGAMDMAGSMNEWVADWYALYDETQTRLFNPIGPDRGTDRILRGGSLANTAPWIRSAVRQPYPPELDYDLAGLGFRCARSP